MTIFDRQGFIETYAGLAAGEMQRAGIPASITLAQAILESNWGQGKVAVEGNNFFGIKCYNGWGGQCVQAMDDEVNPSDFRFYNSVEESFRDHSEFLKNNIRYQPLFEIPVTEYRKWAYGLKNCGYATDIEYAEKLIRLIEEHGLFLYDYAVPAYQFRILETSQEIPAAETFQPEPDVPSYQPSDFRILDTEPAARESEEPVMPAPSYNLGGIVRPQPSIEQEPAGQEAIPSDGQMKIRPVLPLPENRMERR
jgi:hypothetical protein